jgi:hypothetical protein
MKRLAAHAPHYLQESSNRTSENLERKKNAIWIPHFAHRIYPLLTYSIWCMQGFIRNWHQDLKYIVNKARKYAPQGNDKAFSYR